METKKTMTAETAETASTVPKAVRVVARVRSTADLRIESSSTRFVTVHKPKGDDSESVSVSFGDQTVSLKDSCKLDYCYEEQETTRFIYAKEIKPLVSSVFEGKNANVIAHGARCSGKTHLIQGSEKEHGVAVLTMAEMLSMAEERGVSIYVSIYEVSQETVYDVLDQEKRVVSVLEGAQGKIQLKGLSQVHVKTISEFQSLYFCLKKTQNLTSDRPPRSHKGVMIHVINNDNDSCSIGRMNFLDMAGYEDSRKQKSDIAPLEITRINKSIYALHNVMYALNANESHVPYRESKLTHVLKDCLQGCNKTLLITCLHREFSQDSFYMLNLASRIYQGSNRAVTNVTKKKINTPATSVSSSSVVQRRYTPLTVSASSRKQSGLRSVVTERKTKINTPASAIKGRKLFGEANDSVKCKINSRKIKSEAKMMLKKDISAPKVVLSVQDSSSEEVITEEVCSSFIVTDSQSSFVEEKQTDLAFSSSTIAIESDYTSNASLISEVINTINEETPRKHEEMVLEPTCCDDGTVLKGETEKLTEKKGESLDIENNGLIANQTASPPLSIRLQELSNTLKSICKDSNPSSFASEKYHYTSLTKLQAERVSIEHEEAVVIAEQRTPEKFVPSDVGCSPWKTYSAQSARLKKSAVSEYLKFLNTAEKEDLKKLKGIGEKRATYIVELRGESPEPFKTLDDLKDIGLSEKQIKGLVRKEFGDVFN